MIRFILNSLLLLFFFGIVTASKDFDVVMDNKEFKTTNSLIAVYSQHVSHPSEGYHKAEFILNTNFPSFNPDQSGVKSVICKTGANGKRKITFRLKDKKAVGHVNEWPEKIMLLISHKWKCFGERSTQFFTATDRVINESKLVVTFDIEESDFPHNSDYELNINWVHGNQTNNNTHHLNQEEKFHFPHIPKPHLPHLPKPHLPHLPKPHLPHHPVPFPTINKSNKLDLDVLFDSKTGKTSKPDIKIISNKVMELLCANCFTTGDATVTLRIAGNLVPPKVKEASISLNGNFHINLDFALESTAKASNNHRENSLAKGIILISFGLSPLSIPGILTLGPAIDLVADADVSTGTTGIIGFGGDLTLPNFNVQASFGGNPSFTQSGFTPTVNAHTPKASIEASASISASLKPQLSFGMIVFKGRVLKQTVGFEFVETLENLFTFGTGGCKNKPLPHLESDLDSSIGFFVDNRDFPIFKTTKPLLDKCL